MIHFDQWIQDVQVQLDREAAVIEHTEDYYGPWARLIDDCLHLTYDMDEEAWLHDRECV